MTASANLVFVSDRGSPGLAGCDIPETGKGHRQSSGTSTVLGLDDLVTSELDTCEISANASHGKDSSHTVDKSIVTVSGDLEAGGNLAEQRNNGLARVATNNRNGGISGVLHAGELLGEGLGTNDVQSGHTEQTLGIEDTRSLEDLGGDRDGRVHRVGDNEDESLGGKLGDALDETLHNSGIDLEKVVTGHTGLA